MVIIIPGFVSLGSVRTYVLLSLLVPTLSCGGKADNNSSDEAGGRENGTHQGGSIASGGTLDTLPSIGGATSTGGTIAVSSTQGVGAQPQTVGGSTGRTTCAGADTPLCVHVCDGQWRGDIVPLCQDGNWMCPGATIDFNDCPADSCAKSYQLCCNPVTGELSAAPCDQNGYREACRSPTRPTQSSSCIPDDLDITQCARLEGKPCPVVGRRCEQSGTHCSCEEEKGTSGEVTLAWRCVVDLLM